MTHMHGRTRKRTAGLVAALGLTLSVGSTTALAAPAIAATRAAAAPAAEVSVVELEVNSLDDPMGIDETRPVFSWALQSNVVGAKQESYRIEVARDAGFDQVVWNSGAVENDESTDITYGSTGESTALRAETDYWWRVTVVDDRDERTTSEVATFSTGLMNRRMSAWDGAQWIGNDDVRLDAQSAHTFDINTGFQINTGDNVSFIFGADDPRFSNEFRNVFGGPGGENFVRFELDLSGVTNDASNTGGVVNIYRKGYHATDDDNGDPNAMPYKSVRLIDSTSAAVRNLFTPANKNAAHTLRIQGAASVMTYTIDGVALTGFGPSTMTVGAGRPAATNNLNVSPNSTISAAQAHTFVTGNNYNTFPHLNSIGFSVRNVGDDVTLTDYRLVDWGQSAKRVLFDATTAANYSRFTSLANSGMTTTGNQIRINPTAAAQLGPKYADPSHTGQTQVRTEFQLDGGKDIAEARMYVTAQGAYEMFINGERMSDDYLNPGMATYAKTLNYHTYDVTDMLSSGTNAIGAMLGPGFWTGNMTFTPNNYNMFGDNEALLARMVVTYADGSTDTIVTDPTTWKAYTDGPNRYADNFQGVLYDARREASVAGWATADYPTSKLARWVAADVVPMKPQLTPDLVARQDQPVHEVERLTATRVLTTHSDDDTVYTYDMGVNMVGVPSVTIPAGTLQAGDEVYFRFGEDIYPGNSDSPNETWPGPDPRVSEPKPYADLYGPNGSYRPGVAGRVLTDTYRAAMAMDTYVAGANNANADVTITPNFTFRGYRYIEITVPRRTTPLPLENVEGIVLSSIDMPEGEYEATTSDDNYTGDLVNQFFDNVQRSQLGNFFSLPTDCPQRNERMGWTGDLQAYARSATYNSLDTQGFLRQWMGALRDAQGVNGGIGDTVPIISLTGDRGTNFPQSPTWEGAVAQTPWQLYQQYGDERIIRENMPTIKAWLDGYASGVLSPDYPGLTSRTSGNADHISMDANTQAHMVGQAMYLHWLEISAKMADVIGDSAYAATLRQRYEQGKDSFNRLYVDPQTGFTLNATPGATLVSGRTLQDSQASYATPLNLGLFSDTMTVQAGPNEGLTYREFATKRLRELVEDPAQSNNGNGPLAGTGLFSGGQASNKPYTMTTGFNGTPNILPALSRNGEVETAYRLFSSDDFASWLYPVTLGATTMWELWNSYERGFAQGGNSQMNSQNHFALGASQAWMYEYQLGITSDGAKGYRDFVLQPAAGGNFTSLEGSFTSSYGKIESSWTASEGVMESYATTVPANTTATLYLPVEDEVTEFENVPGVSFVGMTERNGMDVAEFEVGAGGYEFDIDGGTVTAMLADGYVAEGAASSVTADAVEGTYGAATTVVATVEGDQPTGTVSVMDGETELGSGELVDGTAEIEIDGTALDAGTHDLDLTYSGDDGNAASAGTVQVTIAKAATTVDATVRPAAPKAGTRPKVVVTVGAEGATPTGTVKVKSGGKVLGSGEVNAQGRVTIQLTKQKAGTRKLLVRYLGSDNFAKEDAVVTLRVRR